MRKLLNLFLVFAGFGYVFISVNVNKVISEEDIAAIKKLETDKYCLNMKDFSDEIKCIKRVQQAQLEIVKSQICRGRWISAEPQEFLKANYGCCYDRSRFIQKALTYYGLKTRQIHINDITRYGYLSIFVPATSSHSTTEVKTSRGWMGVDSNQNFILLDNYGEPLTYRESIDNGLAFELSGKDYYRRPLTTIIGLYSRNGTFFKPYLPLFPEINFIEFTMNFI